MCTKPALLLGSMLIAAAVLPSLAAADAASPSAGALTIAADTRTAERQLIGDSLLNGQAYEYDRQLADSIGPRLTGSANFQKAVSWAEQQFKTLGLSNVHTEEWIIPATWEPEIPAAGHIVSPVDHTLHIVSLGWSPSTPPGGVTGKVVHVKGLTVAKLDEQKLELAGAIVTTGIANGAESMTALGFSGTISPQPEVQVGLEDSLLIKRLLEHGPVSLHFSATNRIRTDVKVSNVIAELPGKDKSAGVVLVGAHLDSWQPGTGAQDSGTGVASVIETARAMKGLNRPPRRTVRFALFGGVRAAAYSGLGQDRRRAGHGQRV